MPDEPLCNVVLFNDDETTMEFVVNAFQRFIGVDYDGANKLMLRIHHEGKAVCGTYAREQAEATAASIQAFADAHNQSLECVLEEAR